MNSKQIISNVNTAVKPKLTASKTTEGYYIGPLIIEFRFEISERPRPSSFRKLALITKVSPDGAEKSIIHTNDMIGGKAGRWLMD